MHNDDSHIEWGYNNHTGEEAEEGWLISYADLMTLLFGFFVIISSISTPDAQKFEKLKKETTSSMGGKYTDPYEKISKSFSDYLKASGLSSDISMESTDQGLIISGNSGVFFKSASAKLNPKGNELMVNIAKIMRDAGLDHEIYIEGHTDDVDIHTAAYPSNWELSSRRATSVVRLFESLGIPHDYLRPVGLADTEPIVPVKGLTGYALEKARARNRRVVIRIQKKVYNDTSAAQLNKKNKK